MKLLTTAAKYSYIPILLSNSLVNPLLDNSTGFEISREQIQNHYFDNNRNAINYLDTLTYREVSKSMVIESQLESYYSNWRKETIFSSDVNSIIQNANFQGIISFKENSIPFILKKISVEPSTLVWALNFITGRKIGSNINVTVTEACKLWCKWGKKEGLV